MRETPTSIPVLLPHSRLWLGHKPKRRNWFTLLMVAIFRRVNDVFIEWAPTVVGRKSMINRSFIFERIPNLSRMLSSRGILLLALMLVCFSSTAAMAWPPWASATSSGGNGYTFAEAIKVAPNGDYYVTGQFSGTAKFALTTLVSAGGADIFLAKYAASGKLIWIVRSGGTEDDAGVGLALDKAGDVYLTGGFTDSAIFGSQ